MNSIIISNPSSAWGPKVWATTIPISFISGIFYFHNFSALIQDYCQRIHMLELALEGNGGIVFADIEKGKTLLYYLEDSFLE